jgi:hypothetical protein
MKQWLCATAVVAILTGTGVVTQSAMAEGKASRYNVTITNLTRGQSFTPIIVASHRRRVALFEFGAQASPVLAALAEAGDTDPIADQLKGSADVQQITSSGGLLDPGQSTTVNIEARRNYNRISLAAMLIPTNDAFFAIQGVRTPRGKNPRVVYAIAYDAGSETNDEACVNIPGPVCGGAALSPNDTGEGYVHVHAGIHGIGDLLPEERDWRNPVAGIAIQRAD